jgi:hypothetical protein
MWGANADILQDRLVHGPATGRIECLFLVAGLVIRSGIVHETAEHDSTVPQIVGKLVPIEDS